MSGRCLLRAQAGAGAVAPGEQAKGRGSLVKLASQRQRWWHALLSLAGAGHGTAKTEAARSQNTALQVPRSCVALSAVFAGRDGGTPKQLTAGTNGVQSAASDSLYIGNPNSRSNPVSPSYRQPWDEVVKSVDTSEADTYRATASVANPLLFGVRMQVAVTSGVGALIHTHSSQASEASPGLVSSITSVQKALVSFAPSVVAERRVARLKRAVWAAGHLQRLADRDVFPSVCWFVTLTYVGVDDWTPKHISKACAQFRKWCSRQEMPCRYIWVAELQKRGAVHYHLLAWIPRGVDMPHWDMERGRRTWWPHGMSNTQPAKSGVGYLMKYLSKLGEFHRFPQGLRLYGIGGLCEMGRKVRTWYNLPEWAKREHGVGEVARRDGRLALLATGELLKSPWHTQLVPSGVQLTLTRELAPKFHDGAYSTWPPTTG